MMHASAFLLLATLALAGCGYQPPPQTDTAAPAYTADLKTCKTTAPATVAKQDVKRFPTWVVSPITRWGQRDTAVDSCMADKGYGRVRWCTDAELRSGTRSGSVVVTAAGIKCSDPPAPDRRRAS